MNCFLFLSETLIDGEPILKLPPKTIYLEKVEFSPEERDFYTRLEADSRTQFKVNYGLDCILVVCKGLLLWVDVSFSFSKLRILCNRREYLLIDIIIYHSIILSLGIILIMAKWSIYLNCVLYLIYTMEILLSVLAISWQKYGFGWWFLFKNII